MGQTKLQYQLSKTNCITLDRNRTLIGKTVSSTISTRMTQIFDNFPNCFFAFIMIGMQLEYFKFFADSFSSVAVYDLIVVVGEFYDLWGDLSIVFARMAFAMSFTLLGYLISITNYDIIRYSFTRFDTQYQV